MKGEREGEDGVKGKRESHPIIPAQNLDKEPPVPSSIFVVS